jgi:hypothetical protein
MFTFLGTPFLFCLMSRRVLAQEKATISGYVRDQRSGEGLIGAPVSV